MKIKTKDLIGPALDWAVAKCEVAARGVHPGYLEIETFLLNHRGGDFCYSTDWSQGGPIIEREKLEMRPGLYHSELWACWGQTQYGHRLSQQGKTGPTPLVAAMRCYVASKLGDEVEVPDELMET